MKYATLTSTGKIDSIFSSKEDAIESIKEEIKNFWRDEDFEFSVKKDTLTNSLWYLFAKGKDHTVKGCVISMPNL